MSAHDRHRGFEGPIEDLEQFWRDNAVALIRERDQLIARLRKTITDLEKRCYNLRRELRQYRRPPEANHA